MGFKQGCLKPGLIGCLVILIIGVILVGIAALLAWRGLDKRDIKERERTPVVAEAGEVPPAGPGRVILDLAQGEFEIHPARLDEGLSVEASYDQEVYELKDHYESAPDSSWVYRLQFRRTMPGLEAFFRSLMGGKSRTYVHIYLPLDSPLALEVHSQEGGFEADLSGVWITRADFTYEKGGFSLKLARAGPEPMDSLVINGAMGGFEAIGLGYASPRLLDVNCRMGGADLNLRGPWARDCDIRLAIRMGGMSVLVPDGVDVQGVPTLARGLQADELEVAPPVLTFSITQTMGQVEVKQR